VTLSICLSLCNYSACKDDIPRHSAQDVNSSHDWHSVATWTAPTDNDTFGTITLGSASPFGNAINWGTGLDADGAATGEVPPDYITLPSDDSEMSKESLILIAAGSVGAVVLLALLIRYIRRHCMQSAAAERYDANKEHRKRVSMEIGKNVFAFGLEIADYISDALSASAVFGLMGDDVCSSFCCFFLHFWSLSTYRSSLQCLSSCTSASSASAAWRISSTALQE